MKKPTKKPMRKPMKRTEFRRTAWMKRGDTPLAKANPERQARVSARRSTQRATPEARKLEREARKLADARANGICECGCRFPFGEYRLDRKHFHHEHYDPPRGIMVRRRCHDRIEKAQYPHRHPRGRTYG